MIALVSLAELNSKGPVQQIANTFGVDWPHLAAQIVSFSIVCLILHRFAYKPVLQMLEERRQQISQGLANAEKIRAELAQTEIQRHDVLLRANVEAAKLIEEARAAAARLQAQETQKAVAAAEQIILKARAATAQEHERMLAELKREIAQLVIRTTAAVIGKSLTQDDQRRMAEETVKQLAAAA